MKILDWLVQLLAKKTDFVLNYVNYVNFFNLFLIPHFILKNYNTLVTFLYHGEKEIIHLILKYISLQNECFMSSVSCASFNILHASPYTFKCYAGRENAAQYSGNAQIVLPRMEFLPRRFLILDSTMNRFSGSDAQILH